MPVQQSCFGLFVSAALPVVRPPRVAAGGCGGYIPLRYPNGKNPSLSRYAGRELRKTVDAK